MLNVQISKTCCNLIRCILSVNFFSRCLHAIFFVHMYIELFFFKLLVALSFMTLSNLEVISYVSFSFIQARNKWQSSTGEEDLLKLMDILSTEDTAFTHHLIVDDKRQKMKILFFQTGFMKFQMQKYPKIIFVDQA